MIDYMYNNKLLFFYNSRTIKSYILRVRYVLVFLDVQCNTFPFTRREKFVDYQFIINIFLSINARKCVFYFGCDSALVNK
jgi:hypothetical protein